MLTRRATLGLFAATPLLAAPLVLSAARPALASEPPVFTRDGIAISGADPVAYFTEGEPVIGSAEFAADWMGAPWHFASAANRDTFLADPEAYAPAFGGYCAFAASRGALAATRPEAWTVYEDRLYLNANLHARELWLSELPDVIAAGEANWPAILG
ncbi:YHS domain-containing protein [Rhodobacterales bacterium HKCCE2091]|nr:YHS domain-containing protein [Rhodobacterales bacterium HKCCE2091]